MLPFPMKILKTALLNSTATQPTCWRNLRLTDKAPFNRQTCTNDKIYVLIYQGSILLKNNIYILLKTHKHDTLDMLPGCYFLMTRALE